MSKKFGTPQIVAARAWAREHYADPSDDDIEIPDDALVTRSADDGLWVEARVYVRFTDITP